MAKFELSDAVSVFSEQASNITALWTVYVAATFAAAVYSVQIKDVGAAKQTYVVAAVTVGFLAFALGHLSLIVQALKVNQAIARDITRYLHNVPKIDIINFEHTLKTLSRTANPLWPSIVAHLIIDASVTVALLVPIGLILPWKSA